MKNLISLGLAGALAILISGCSLKTSAPQGHMIDLHKIDMKEVSQMKKGTACRAMFLIFPVSTDDTLLTAAANGNISKIEYVEKHISRFPFIYEEYCTDVFGK